VLCFVVLQDFIPPSRWCIESLHLILNTGNCWIEVACNTFQYLSYYIDISPKYSLNIPKTAVLSIRGLGPGA
jgi:hypothetical protein